MIPKERMKASQLHKVKFMAWVVNLGQANSALCCELGKRGLLIYRVAHLN